MLKSVSNRYWRWKNFW